MSAFGRVKALINDKLLIVEMPGEPATGDVLSVFSSLQDARLSEQTGLDRVLIPKGEIRIVCRQAKDIYLAEVFRSETERRSTVTVPSPWQKALSGLAAQLQPETKEIVEKVPGPQSGILDDKASLKLDFSTRITVNDPVGVA